jgi:hypothetical protein
MRDSRRRRNSGTAGYGWLTSRTKRKILDGRNREEGVASLLLPLLLQGREEMVRAVELVLMLADCQGGAVCPVAWLGGFPPGQVPGLRFVLQPYVTCESGLKLGHATVPHLSATRPQSAR